MSDEERIQLMMMVKEKMITIEEALARVGLTCPSPSPSPGPHPFRSPDLPWISLRQSSTLLKRLTLTNTHTACHFNPSSSCTHTHTPRGPGIGCHLSVAPSVVLVVMGAGGEALWCIVGLLCQTWWMMPLVSNPFCCFCSSLFSLISSAGC